MICRLCLTGTEFCITLKNAKTQEEDEELEDMAGIIGKHFDLSLDVNTDLVCTFCWQQIKDFHLFYLFIEEKQKELTHQSQLLALTCTKMKAELTDAEMRDEDGDDDGVDIKDESTIDISSPMITENNLSQWDKVGNLHEETEKRPTTQNDDLIDTVNVEQSRNSVNANGNSNDVSVTSGVLGTETHRKEASNENIQQILKFAEFQCPHCPKKFAMMGRLNQHKKRTHGEQKLKCDECNKEFKSVDSFTYHKRRDHLGIYRTACDICGKIFQTSNVIKRHKARAHPDESTLKFQCPHCPKKFAMMGRLNQHKKKHQKPKCDECNEEFKSVYRLRIHKRRDHLGIYRTECNICGKLFPTPYYIKLHKASAHPDESTLKFQCSHCPKKFALMGLLTKHKKRVHGEQKLKSKSNPPMRAQKGCIHLRTHKIVCYICCETFSSKSNYELHKEAVHKDTEDTDTENSVQIAKN